MSSQTDAMAEVLRFVRNWSQRTDERVLSEIKRLKIGVTRDLLNSVKSKVLELAADKLAIEMSFLGYGRLVDMGAGPGSVDRVSPTIQSIVASVESPSTKRALLGIKRGRKKKARRAKKFYSKAVYSRFNALLGIISGAMVEEAVSIVRKEVSADPFSDMAMFM